MQHGQLRATFVAQQVYTPARRRHLLQACQRWACGFGGQTVLEDGTLMWNNREVVGEGLSMGPFQVGEL